MGTSVAPSVLIEGSFPVVDPDLDCGGAFFGEVRPEQVDDDGAKSVVLDNLQPRHEHLDHIVPSEGRLVIESNVQIGIEVHGSSSVVSVRKEDNQIGQDSVLIISNRASCTEFT